MVGRLAVASKRAEPPHGSAAEGLGEGAGDAATANNGAQAAIIRIVACTKCGVRVGRAPFPVAGEFDVA